MFDYINDANFARMPLQKTILIKIFVRSKWQNWKKKILIFFDAIVL